MKWFLLVVMGFLATSGLQALTPESQALAGLGGVDRKIQVTAIDGKEVRPFACAGASGGAAVVVFITTDCPIANRYAPEIERIRADYEGKGVKMTLVHVNPDLTNEAAGKHAAEYALKAEVVIDRKHRLVDAAGAKVTPEAFVIDGAGQIRYRGRINDQFADFGDQRREAKTNDLRDAITAVLEGRPVKRAVTEAIGCFISPLR